ncbi:hypothetical protein CFC21_097329 [Triticum aestivum]|uniref:Uncharacterized protein n=3 Tax=Triticum TaxID=4564 RepID=A0A9R0ZBC6_TRITD|nr:hypothetical protein CFC21_097329 [Triticum aestivum]VAI73438.1 unnamed protein product [Triticum turgidum subsp. durum]
MGVGHRRLGDWLLAPWLAGVGDWGRPLAGGRTWDWSAPSSSAQVHPQIHLCLGYGCPLQHQAPSTSRSASPPLLLLEFEQHGQHPSMPQQQGHETQTNEVQFRGIEFLQRDPALRPQIRPSKDFFQAPPLLASSVMRNFEQLHMELS